MGFESGFRRIDDRTWAGPRNLLDGYPAFNADGSANAVIEAPAGTIAKWEVSKPEGLLRLDEENGRPRMIRYLAYPANYGMIPCTLLARAQGGDGDPIDVVLLGESLPRGSVHPVRVIGVLRLLDRGQRDDKLIAVPLHGTFAGIDRLSSLQAKFPGILRILEIWFTSYKGPGQSASEGFGEAEEAQRMLDAAAAAFDPQS